jgi:hypothetical protein
MAMTDPRFTDPRYSESRFPDRPDTLREEDNWTSSSLAWGWVAGIAVLALVVIFLMSGGPSGTQTAGTNAAPPPATTGSVAPMRNVTPPRPAPMTPPSTTGQGPQQ